MVAPLAKLFQWALGTGADNSTSEEEEERVPKEQTPELSLLRLQLLKVVRILSRGSEYHSLLRNALQVDIAGLVGRGILRTGLHDSVGRPTWEQQLYELLEYTAEMDNSIIRIGNANADDSSSIVDVIASYGFPVKFVIAALKKKSSPNAAVMWLTSNLAALQSGDMKLEEEEGKKELPEDKQPGSTLLADMDDNAPDKPGDTSTEFKLSKQDLQEDKTWYNSVKANFGGMPNDTLEESCKTASSAWASYTHGVPLHPTGAACPNEGCIAG